MAESLTYFQTMIEAIVGIIGFQVIAVSFVFSRKEDWHIHDSFMFYAVIFLNMMGMLHCAVPFFVSINLSTDSSSFDFWDICYKIGLASQFVLLIHGHLYNVKLFRDIKLFPEEFGVIAGWRYMFQYVAVYTPFPIFCVIYYTPIYTEHLIINLAYAAPWLFIFLSFVPFIILITHSHPAKFRLRDSS
jgi:hypothetical protein